MSRVYILTVRLQIRDKLAGITRRIMKEKRDMNVVTLSSYRCSESSILLRAFHFFDFHKLLKGEKYATKLYMERSLL